MRYTLVPLALVPGLVVLSLVGCARSGAGNPPAAAVAAPAVAGTQAGSAQILRNSLKGTVLEILPASPYTYLRLKAEQGEVWAAVPAADLKVGASATVQVQLRMANFQSEALHRTFDVVYLGTLEGAAPAVPAASPVPAHAQPAGPGPEKVAKAAGPDGYAIAELYSGRDRLKDRNVVVKAKVTKALGGIMGRTWLHLRDGSGQAQDRNFDLPVTTLDAAKVGEVVTVKGVLHLNRDFGSGYVYPVILEDAKVVR